ncbi:MAG: 1-acyl-sn-glycerol-3-phosphate acyltransferase [Cyanobacteria bacterium J06639_1]
MLLRGVHAVLPLLLRYRSRRWLTAGITRIEVDRIETLVELYRQFQAREIRLFLAFRHPEVDDPMSFLYVLSRSIPRAARQQGIALRSPLHAHYLYDRGMPLWGGAWLGWLLSRLGGVPIHRGRRLDLKAIRAARDLAANGRLPMAIAPEGANNGHSERIGPLELGMSQLGFWCAEDLHKAGRKERVIVVPMGVRYRFVQPPWKPLDRLLSRLETECGLTVDAVDLADEEKRGEHCARRLRRLGDRLLSDMEEFYRRLEPRLAVESGLTAGNEQELGDRLQVVLDTALRVAESQFGLSSAGTLSARCRRIEEAGWMAIYREDLPALDAVSPVQRRLADWEAEAAEAAVRHMRLVESFVAVSDDYACDRPTVERLAEVASILSDCMARIQGIEIPKRPQLGKRWVQLTVREPIEIGDRWPLYSRDRQGAKQAVKDLTEDLRVALEEAIAD